MSHVAAAMGRNITFVLCPDRQCAVLLEHSTLVRHRDKMLPWRHGWLYDAGVEENWIESLGGQGARVLQTDAAACTQFSPRLSSWHYQTTCVWCSRRGRCGPKSSSPRRCGLV